MKPKLIVKLVVDFCMTGILLFLMLYERIGRVTHEWLGIAMFVLFLSHHILNRNWIRNLFRGAYTPFRILQTLLVFIVLVCMIGSMVSGVILSRHLFLFLPISGGRSFARTIHLLCAYWGYICLALHLGLHWSIMVGVAKKFAKKPSKIRTTVFRILAILIAGYGIYAVIKRKIASYMLLQNQFVFFDFEEPIIFFFGDYLAIMGLFVWIGHYSTLLLKRIRQKRRKENE
ncbi:MAG: DUF4405 domain-containing protein [Lachnospiraceae bacterium]|nr:DUF4405 domain-containing protein [Lachnospiraceae bacterium]